MFFPSDNDWECGAEYLDLSDLSKDSFSNANLVDLWRNFLVWIPILRRFDGVQEP